MNGSGSEEQCVIMSGLHHEQQHIQILKYFHSELICSVASVHHENNELKHILAQNVWLGYLSDFRKLPRIWVASSKTPMQEFIF